MMTVVGVQVTKVSGLYLKGTSCGYVGIRPGSLKIGGVWGFHQDPTVQGGPNYWSSGEQMFSATGAFGSVISGRVTDIVAVTVEDENASF